MLSMTAAAIDPTRKYGIKVKAFQENGEKINMKQNERGKENIYNDVLRAGDYRKFEGIAFEDIVV